MKKDRPQVVGGLNGAQAAVALTVRPRHPGSGLLSDENWLQVAAQLHLTAREFSVAVLLFEGKTRFQIARRLKCAPGTVRVYIDRLFAKLNVKDRLGVALGIVRVHLAMPAAPTSHKDATSKS
jgi:DNA-binding NarL/FixJ family response regulator